MIAALKRLYSHDEPLAGPLSLSLHFDLPYPKSWPKKRKRNYENEPHLTKPDIDNLVKWVLDCMNGVVFHDDRQIVALSCQKNYCDHDGSTFIFVRDQDV